MEFRKTLLLAASCTLCVGNLMAEEPPLAGSPSEAIKTIVFQPGTQPRVAPLTPEERRVAEARAAAAAAAERASLENLPSNFTLFMQGDQGPMTSPPFSSFGHNNGRLLSTHSAQPVPSIRGFKIAEDESPRPIDRLYFDFNYFDNINKAVNERQGVVIHDLRAYRETFGVEKTFLDGDASFGLRLPIDTLSAESAVSSLAGSSTDIGDLSMILKYAYWRDCDTGNLLSAGIALTVPTGPSTFGGYPNVVGAHHTTIQPWLGGIFHFDRLYVHGFASIDVPFGSPDVTFLYNDIGVGYLAYINRAEDRIITAIAPTIEMHINTPLNHRGALQLTDNLGSPDVIDLTFGTSVEVMRDATFRIGLALPITGPRPFDYEIQAQLTWVFGRSRGTGDPVVFSSEQ